MKAVTFDRYGDVGVLLVGEQQAARPGRGEVRVRVKASSLNPIDWKVRSGEMALMSGRRFPHALGSDLVGIVVEVGPAVRSLSVGDEVYGGVNAMKGGAYAEEVTTSAKNLARKPRGVSFVEAAAIPVAGVAALQGLRDLGRVAKGTRVLIHGCTGGVGTFALQIARRMGAHVTGTCSQANAALARELGADEVIDYRSSDLEKKGPFDVLFELSGKLRFAAARRLLAPRGVFVNPTPTPQVIIGSAIANLFRAQKHRCLLSAPNTKDLEELSSLVEAGALRSVVRRTFRLDEIREAHRYGEKGGSVGKVAIEI